MKLKNIDDIKKSISSTLILSFVVVFILSIIAIVVTHSKMENRSKILNHQQIQNIIHNYQSNLSEKLAIIASSNVFIDYIRSGEESRKKLLPEFLYQIRSLNSKSVVGMSIKSLQFGKIFHEGSETPFSVVLKLCYLNTTLDNKLGSCAYTWTLFFDKDKVLNSFKIFDQNLIECTNCKKLDVFSSNKFGSFEVNNHTPLLFGLKYSGRQDNSFYFYSVTLILTLIAFALWNRFRLKIIFEKYIATPIEDITSKIKRGEKIAHHKLEIQEFSYLIDQVENWKNELSKAKEKENEAEIGRLINQILHDVRSPIGVINSVLHNLGEVEEKKRIILKHSLDTLNDIANGILNLAQNKYKKGIQKNSPEPVAMILDRLVSEKRSQNLNKNVTINLVIQKNAYSLFANIDHVSFKRAITNLLNNAIEAVDESKREKKLIEVILDKHENKKIKILIRDNGCGISNDRLNAVLQGGETNKIDGHGMGLTIAKKTIETYSGRLTLESQAGMGTTVSIILPISKAASWFADRIVIFQDSVIAVLDDDKGIHFIWDERIKEISEDIDNIKIKHFYTPAELIDYQINNPDKINLYLIDYELINSDMDGLDVINHLKIFEQAILVTSRYENIDVRQKAQQMKIKIIPKNYASFTPIELVPNNPDFVLLDDNHAVIDVWELRAGNINKRLAAFDDYNAFWLFIKKCKNSIPIYLDSKLGQGLKGEKIAEELYKRGYKNIYITTGSDSSMFQQLYYVKAVIGKEPPF